MQVMTLSQISQNSHWLHNSSDSALEKQLSSLHDLFFLIHTVTSLTRTIVKTRQVAQFARHVSESSRQLLPCPFRSDQSQLVQIQLTITCKRFLLYLYLSRAYFASLSSGISTPISHFMCDKMAENTIFTRLKLCPAHTRILHYRMTLVM